MQGFANHWNCVCNWKQYKDNLFETEQMDWDNVENRPVVWQVWQCFHTRHISFSWIKLECISSIWYSLFVQVCMQQWYSVAHQKWSNKWAEMWLRRWSHCASKQTLARFVCGENVIRPLSALTAESTAHFWTNPELKGSYVHYRISRHFPCHNNNTPSWLKGNKRGEWNNVISDEQNQNQPLLLTLHGEISHSGCVVHSSLCLHEEFAHMAVLSNWSADQDLQHCSHHRHIWPMHESCFCFFCFFVL